MGNSIKSLPEFDRPYERLELYGPDTLTDSELLAVILKNGTKNINALDLSRKLLKQYGSLEKLADAGISELIQNEGIGRVKALQLKAVGEIAKRIGNKEFETKINAKETGRIALMMSNELSGFKVEHFYVLYLDKRLNIFGKKEISVGTADKAIIYPRDIFSAAVRECSFGIILVHNHPSGNPEPSNPDIKVTQRLVTAGNVLGIPVYDHIIVGDRNYYSMRENEQIA